MTMIVLFLLTLFSFNPAAWSSSAFPGKRVFFAMGSELIIESDRDDIFYNNASSALLAFEKNISTWKKTSTLSLFNQSSNKWIEFDQQSFLTLKNSLACSKLTNGYFHPGLGSLIMLWGLREKLNIPREKERELALASADLSTLTFNDAELKIKKNNKQFWFEEGGFAKGAAMDDIVRIAKKSPGKDLLLNFSGQIYSEQKKEVAIADPEKRDSSAIFISIEKESVSTSGIGLKHFTHENITYGHILNPITGVPLGHTAKSVTVIHPENVWADCLSTGLLVMSENKKELRNWMITHPQIKVILLEKKSGMLTAEVSCGLKMNKNLKVSQIIENC